MQLSDDSWHCQKCVLETIPFHNVSNSDSIFNTTKDPLDTSCSSINTSIDTTTATIRGLKCYLINARSIVNKLHDLKALLFTNKPDIIAVTETFLNHDVLDSELADSSYTVFRRDCDRHGGGVMLLINSTINSTRREELENDDKAL